MSGGKLSSWPWDGTAGGRHGSWQGHPERPRAEAIGWQTHAHPDQGRCKRSDMSRQVMALAERTPLEEIQDQLEQRAVVFVAGETGCGKTTTVPWHLAVTLDKQVACCLPRRLQAKRAATWVQQKASPVAQAGDIGWVVGGEQSQHGRRLTYFTHGCFIRHIGQQVESGFDVVIVDEAHEQCMEAQMVMWLLRDFLANNRKVKIVVMSATMDAEELWDYFHKGLPEASRLQMLGNKHETVELGTRRHEVNLLRFEDLPQHFPSNGKLRELCKNINHKMSKGMIPEYNKGDMVHLCAKITLLSCKDEQSVLVFLPGLAEIVAVATLVQRLDPSISVHALHACLSSEEQQKACEPVQWDERRAIFASSVAESSLTFANISHVIDSGITRDTETEDLLGLSVLADEWSPSTVVRQRMGRAGRTQAGVNIRLFTEHVETSFMKAWRYPHWTVSAVASAALLIKIHVLKGSSHGMSVEEVLRDLLIPPSPRLVMAALEQLCWAGFMQPLHARSTPASHDIVADRWPGLCEPAPESHDNAVCSRSLHVTASGHLAVSLPVGLRYGRFLAIALALGELPPVY